MFMKKSLVMCLSFALLIVFVYTSAYAAQSVDSGILLPQKEINAANSKILSLVLDGKDDQIDSLAEVNNLKNLINSNSELQEQFANSIEALKKDSKPVRVYKDLIIDGWKKTIVVYEDGSFNEFGIKTVKESDSNILPLQGTEEVFYDEFSGNGTYDTTIYKNMYSGYLVEHVQLKTTYYNGTSTISISNKSTAGSYCVLPKTLDSTSSGIIQNNAATVGSYGDYNITVWAGVYPLYSVQHSLEFWASKINSTDFSATGNFIS